MARPKSIRTALPGILHFVRYFAPAIKEHRGTIAVAMLALFLQTLFSLLEPWPLKFVIDLITDSQQGRTQGLLPAFITELSTTELLTLLAIALIIFASLRALFTYISTIAFALVGHKVLMRVREQLFNHMQRLSLSYHSEARSGDLVMRLLSDIGMIREVTVTAILPLLGNFLVLAGMLGVMFWLNWQLTLIVVAIMPALFVLTLFKSRKIQRVSRKNRQREGAMAATASETIGAIQTVQSLSLEDAFSKHFSAQNKKSIKEGVKAKRLAAGLERIVDVQIAIALALVLWFGARHVLAGTLSPGELLIFVFYLKRVFRPLRDFAKYTSRLAKASASGERVLEVLQQESDIQDQPGAKVAPAFRGDICFQDIHFGYVEAHPVLKGIQLDIRAGETIAIVGASGSGKTTLSNLLLRLYDPQQGKVLIDQQDIRGLTLASLRKQMSVVLQDGLLFSGTVLENIMIGQPEATQEAVEEAARIANAHAFIEQLPQGYQTPVGERGVTLSQGQRQRIAIARAALQNTPILILDEPTTGLDKDNEHKVSQALKRLAQGRTTLYITHRLEAALQADRVALFAQGRILACTTPHELMETNQSFMELFQLQQNSGTSQPTGEGVS
ncbi:ABC transporter ATP-binding protein [Thiolapillus sp.]